MDFNFFNPLNEEQNKLALAQEQAGQMPPPGQVPTMPTMYPQEDKGFLGNFMQRKILNPLQVSLGMRDSPQDILRKQKSIMNQYEMQEFMRQQGQQNRAAQFIGNMSQEDAQALGLSPAQLRLAQANPIEAYDDIVDRSYSRETYSTTPQYGLDAAGGRIVYQLGDRGSTKLLKYQPSPEYRTVDDGQSIQVYDKFSDTLIQTIPKKMTPEQTERLIIEKSAKTKADEERIKTQTTSLRKEFNNLTKTDREISVAYQKIKQASENPSAAGDLALIFAYMKLLDPGSTVREGEFATAQNAGGVDDRTIALYNRIAKGERLSDKQRGDFFNSSGLMIKPYRDNFDATKIRYSTLAEENGLQPSQVITNDPYSGLNVIKRDKNWYESRGLRPPRGLK